MLFDLHVFWSHVEKNQITEIITSTIIVILIACLAWETLSLSFSVARRNSFGKLVKSRSGLQHLLSPLKHTNGELIILRALPLFIQKSPGRSKIRYFTTVLTSLGVMGTFVGIMTGLAGIDEKLSGDTSQTFNAVKDLLGGMSTAFITSIVGIVASLLLLVVLSIFEKIKVFMHHTLVQNFYKYYRLETLGDYLQKLSPENQQQLLDKQLEVALKNEQASNAMLEMGRTLQQSAESFNADKIGEHISNSLDKIFRSEMVPVFKEISSELTALRAIKQDNGEAIINAIKEEIVKPLTTEIHNTTAMVEQAANAITQLNDDLGNISTKLGESVATIQSFQQETMSQLQHFAGDLRNILIGFQTDTKSILEGVADSIKSAVTQSIEGMTAQRDAFKISAVEAAQTFKNIKVELTTALDHQTALQKDLLEQTANRFDGVIDKSVATFEKQSGLLRDVGEHAAHLMNTSKDNLELSLQSATDSIRSAIAQSIEGMTFQREAFKESAENAAQTFKDIKTELISALDHQTELQKDLLDNSTQRFEGMINHSVRAFEKQSDVLREVGEYAAKLMDSSKDSLKVTLGNIEESLLNTKKVVEEELQLFRTNYQASLTEFFNEQNNLLEQTLGSQRDGLAKVVEECNTVFVEEYQRRKELSTELGRNLSEINQAVDLVSNLVQSVRMLDAAYVNTIEQAASSINRQIAGFEKQQQNTQQVLTQFMQQVPQALNSYFDKANESHVKFFTGMDEAATKIHQRLLQSAEYLVSAEINKRQFAAEEN